VSFDRHCASAIEFPGQPTAEENVVRGSPQSGYSYKLPYTNTTLILGTSRMSPGMQAISEEEQFSAMKEHLPDLGYTVVSESRRNSGATTVFELELEVKENRHRVRTQIAFVGSRICRVVAAPMGSSDQEGIINHFLSYFQIEQAHEAHDN
jgi:hypothetical protein